MIRPYRSPVTAQPTLVPAAARPSCCSQPSGSTPRGWARGLGPGAPCCQRARAEGSQARCGQGSAAGSAAPRQNGHSVKFATAKLARAFCDSSHGQHCTLAALHDPGGQRRCPSTRCCFGVSLVALPRAKRTTAWATRRPWPLALLLPAPPLGTAATPPGAGDAEVPDPPRLLNQ